jgi:hypothetical protein
MAQAPAPRRPAAAPPAPPPSIVPPRISGLALGARRRQARQEALLRTLDTRMACLLVDRRGGEVLRRNLFALRDRLTRETLDPATLAEVEATVRALAPRPSAPKRQPGSGVQPAARPPRRAAGALAARAVSGALGASGLLLLVAQTAV